MTVNKFLIPKVSGAGKNGNRLSFPKNGPRRVLLRPAEGEILVAPGMARGKVRPLHICNFA